jgi:hypothetical protein
MEVIDFERVIAKHPAFPLRGVLYKGSTKEANGELFFALIGRRTPPSHREPSVQLISIIEHSPPHLEVRR